MKKNVINIMIMVFILPIYIQAQFDITGIGTSVGIGQIKGNSTAVTSLSGNVFFDFSLWFSEVVEFRAGFTYARKIEYFLPENREGRYYSFIKLFSLKGIIKQDLYNYFFLEEGVGIIYLNDRTFSDINEWEPGATFHILGGIDFSKKSLEGIKLGLGFDYGITFTKTTATYSLFYLQMQYKF